MICVLVCLAACGDRRHWDASTLALVNDRPVTAAQWGGARQTGEFQTSKPPAVQVLVDEELLVQAAEKARLDRDPAVEQAIENARRQILVRAFAERDLYSREAIAPTQAQAFYEENPILFEDRKRFRVKSYTFEGVELDAKLNMALEGVHSDDDLRALLDKHDIEYTVQGNVLTADLLPLDKLGEFEHAAAGDIIVARPADGKALLMLIVEVERDKAVSFDRAKPYIETYLAHLRNQEAVDAYLSRIRARARIEYPAGAPPARAASHEQGFAAMARATSELP